MNLYFLTTSPSASHAELKSFITDTLSLKSKLINVSIIDENEADNFAATVRKDMEESNIFANF